MSSGQLEENTLGVLVGQTRRAASAGAHRFGRGSAAQRAVVGSSFLGLGAAIVLILRAAYGLSSFVVSWQEHANPLVSLLAWTTLAAVLVAVFATVRLSGDRLPDGMYALLLVGAAMTVGLDVAAVWEQRDIGGTATAAPVAITALLAAVTLRRSQEVVIPVGVLSAALLLLSLANRPAEVDVGWTTTQLTASVLAALPPLIAVAIVEDFGRMVQFELDRVLVQSTVQAPRFAVGMLASEELARLDLAAEELLESVAEGKTPLPLPAKTASVAASLATELRLHLIEGRRETWLYHAISESAMLGRSVTLVDKSSLAGLLDTGQRDGLLSAVWLLLNDPVRARSDRSITLELGPVGSGTEGLPGRKILVPITVTVTNITRNRVDPAIWDAIGHVGKYADSVRASSLKIDIECLVDNPAES